ncbi:MAG TPA: hypothetical protein VGT61_14620 [Thermomicrobiales bacterium]|jgi:hypothetical protein|nr:hypothetical protein [Thermomicrobiales bacterium]
MDRATPVHLRPSELVLGLLVWVVLTALIVLVVGPILPGPTDGAPTLLTYALVCVVTTGASALLAMGWTRFTGQRLDSGTGLRIGVALLVGLFLDGVLVAALGFGYPRADALQTRTITVAFLLAYPLAVAGPWATGWWLESRRSHSAG